jgi:hypothetical protein
MMQRRTPAARAPLRKARVVAAPRVHGAFCSARVLGTLAALACGASGTAQDLPNPFARPEPVRTSASKPAEPQAPPTLELRATLVLDRKSSANIGGTIMRVGQKVGGYRLVSVREGAAVLVDAAGVTYTLEIAPPGQVTP